MPSACDGMPVTALRCEGSVHGASAYARSNTTPLRARRAVLGGGSLINGAYPTVLRNSITTFGASGGAMFADGGRRGARKNSVAAAPSVAVAISASAAAAMRGRATQRRPIVHAAQQAMTPAVTATMPRATVHATSIRAATPMAIIATTTAEAARARAISNAGTRRTNATRAQQSGATTHVRGGVYSNVRCAPATCSAMVVASASPMASAAVTAYEICAETWSGGRIVDALSASGGGVRRPS